jgi:hypothetical protein
MVGKKGHSHDTAGQRTGGEYGRDEYSGGGYDNSGTTGEYDTGATAEHKPGMMEKIKGSCDPFSILLVFGVNIQSVQAVLRR